MTSTSGQSLDNPILHRAVNPHFALLNLEIRFRRSEFNCSAVKLIESQAPAGKTRAEKRHE